MNFNRIKKIVKVSYNQAKKINSETSGLSIYVFLLSNISLFITIIGIINNNNLTLIFIGCLLLLITATINTFKGAVIKLISFIKSIKNNSKNKQIIERTYQVREIKYFTKKA